MNIRSNPLAIVRRWAQRQKNERFLRRWAARRDGDTTGVLYVKRHYELNFAFYDVYWYVKSAATRQRVYTHYVRISEEQLISKINAVEASTLPQIISDLHLQRTPLAQHT